MKRERLAEVLLAALVVFGGVVGVATVVTGIAPESDAEYLYASNNDNEVQKIDPSDVTVSTRFTGHSDNVGAVRWYDGHVISSSADGTTHKLDPADLSSVASYGGGSDVLTIGNGHLYIESASGSGTVEKVDVSDMTQVTTVSTGEDIRTILVFDGSVYVGYRTTHSIDVYAASGLSHEGTVTTDLGVYDITASDGYLYSADRGSNVSKIDPEADSVVDYWTLDASQTDYLTAVAASGEYVYAGDSTGVVHKLAKSDMSQVATYNTGNAEVSSLLVGPSGYLHAGTDSDVYQIDQSDMTKVQSRSVASSTTTGLTTGPPATAGGSSGVSQTFAYRDLDADREWEGEVRYSLWERTDSGRWVHLGALDENWNGRATFQGLESDRSHRIQLLHQSEVAMYEVVGFEPGWQSSPWTIPIAPDGTESSSSPTATGTGTPAPTSCPAGTIQTGTDESGSTEVILCGGPDSGGGFQQVDFDFEGPDGETWEYNQTFPDPPEWYGANYTQNATNISNPDDWSLNYSVQDENGTWYNGTTDLGGGENFLTGESLSGGTAPLAGSDTTLPPLAIWASMAAVAAGFYYRKPGRRAALAESLSSSWRGKP